MAGSRRYDPRRRERIARAAVKVIGERGVEGLTHRAVAEAADVPLAGTTYHYRSKNDLIQAALEHAVTDYVAAIERVAADHPDATAELLVDLTADALVDCFTVNHTLTAMQLELYAAAIRRPALQPIAERFTAATYGLYARYLDPLTAALLTDTAQGITMRGMAGRRPPARAQIHALLMRCLPQP